MRAKQVKRLRKDLKKRGFDTKQAVYFEDKVATSRGVRLVTKLEPLCGRFAYKAAKKELKRASMVERIR
jgi:hypothetical protein